MKNAKLRIWDEKYREWEELPMLAYPQETIRKQGRIIDFFIGLSDSEGKEIYSNDILDVQELGVGEVIYDDFNACFKINFSSCPAKTFSEISGLTRKIIGNTHQVYSSKWQRTPPPSQTPKLRP